MNGEDKQQRFTGVEQEKLLVKRSITVYEIHSLRALYQIIGYYKFNCPDSLVLYRGQNGFSAGFILQAQLDREEYHDNIKNSENIINMFTHRSEFLERVKFTYGEEETKYKVEAVMQHYGVPTHSLDVVDTPWVALWFGLYRCESQKGESGQEEWHYHNRANILDEKDDFVYILLLDVPFDGSKRVSIRDNIVAMDLRRVIPSQYIRPHAQHAWIIRKVFGHESDFNQQILAVIKIRKETVNQWLGNGSLFKTENLFPSQTRQNKDPDETYFDYGLDCLMINAREMFGENKIFPLVYGEE